MYCPFCGSTNLTSYKNSDSQVNAIYCDDCPCGLEDSTKTLKELEMFWLEKFNKQDLELTQAIANIYKQLSEVDVDIDPINGISEGDMWGLYE